MIGISASTLFPGERFLVWAHDRTLATVGFPEPAAIQNEYFELTYKRRVGWVSAPEAVGSYPVIVNGEESGRTIEVIARPQERNRVEIAPGESWLPHITVPNTELVLLPGRHKPAGNFQVAHNVGVSADVAGTVVVEQQPHGKYKNRIFRTFGNFFSLSRLVFEGTAEDDYVCHDYPADGIKHKVTECVFKRCALGMFAGNSLIISGCTFRNLHGLFGLTSHHLVIDSEIIGFGGQMQTKGADSLAVVRCKWDGTRRGFFSQPSAGPVTNCLFYMLNFRNISWEENGQEVFMVEGDTNPFSQNLMRRFVFEHSNSVPISLYASNCFDNAFDEMWINGGQGIVLDGGRGDNYENVFKDIELIGGTVIVEHGHDNLFERVTVLNPIPSRDNSAVNYFTTLVPGEKNFYRPAFDIQGDGNTLKNCVVSGVRPGYEKTVAAVIEGAFLVDPAYPLS